MSRTPATDGFFMPAEWTAHDGCWMAWPGQGAAWGEGFEMACMAVAGVARVLNEYEPVTMLTPPSLLPMATLQLAGRVETLAIELDDCWSRDIVPTFLVDGDGGLAAAAFDFNGWGNKNHDHDRDARLGGELLEAMDLPCYQVPMTLEGGAVHVDGSGTLLTTESVVLNPNRNPTLDRCQVAERLALYFGVRKVIWLPGGLVGDPTDGHVGKVARFVAPAKVMCAVASDADDPSQADLLDNLGQLAAETDALGRPLEVIEVPLPAPRQTDGGRPLALSYLDFYIANGAVIVPAFDDPRDDEAARLIGAAFPDHLVAQIDIGILARRGGGIHGLTQQQPART
ncbi:MAG: agmatine deiminase family protein [Alphaproteobacteria bacterium]|nr:agmatine deiminase family protein [Alphaproteobacteria bacterium]